MRAKQMVRILAKISAIHQASLILQKDGLSHSEKRGFAKMVESESQSIIDEFDVQVLPNQQVGDIPF